MADLTRLDTLPDGFLDCPARELHRLLAGPSLIELPGRREAPLFVSMLLHGNEDTGLAAVQEVLRAHAGKELPRPLMLLVGNVAAAREGQRRLDGQPDYNRIWPGAPDHVDTPEARAMAEVHERVLARNAFAAVDLHNNSGLNPHYGVVCSLDAPSLHLAALFARIAVWFTGLPGTETASFAGKLPAITAECGQPGVAANAEHAARFLDGVLHLSEFPAQPVHRQDLDLYHTLAVVRVRPDVSLSFGEGEAELELDPALDHLNFREVAAGTRFGATSHPMPFEVVDDDGRDVAAEYFSTEGGELRLKRAAVPAMLTSNVRIIRQDSLCYLMERVPEGIGAFA